MMYLLCMAMLTSSGNHRQVNISNILDGRHWIDGRSGDLTILDSGFHHLSSIDPCELKIAVRDYLTFYRDESGVPYLLKSSSVIYRRSIDIAVLNSLLFDPSLFRDARSEYGYFEARAHGRPWKRRKQKWQLQPPAVQIDPNKAEPFDALGEFYQALRVYTLFAEDNILIERSNVANPELAISKPIELTLVGSGKRLLKAAGLKIYIKAHNRSIITMPVPAHLTFGTCWFHKFDPALVRSPLIKNYGYRTVKMRPLLPGALIEYNAVLEQGLDFDKIKPGEYSIRVTVSTRLDHNLWRPPPNLLFRRFESSIELVIEIPQAGDYFVLREA